jgi:hypothetical protein
MLYRDIPATLTTLDKQMVDAFGPKKNELFDIEEFYELLSIKSKNFKDEKEWRCFYHAAEADIADKDQSDWYIDREFDATDLTGIIYGYNINQIDRQSVMTIVKEKYKRSKLFQASLSSGKFSLEFDKL